MTLTAQERTDIAQAALAVAQDWEELRALPLDDLMALSPEDAEAYLRTTGVSLDWERLELEVRNALGTDLLLLDRGRELSPAQLDALEQRVRRVVLSTARTTVNQTLGDLRQEAFVAADDRGPEEQWYVRVAVGAGSCNDCLSLHGIVGRLDFWQGNMPRDGNTVCKGACRCMVMPCGAPASGEDGVRA